MVLTATGAAMQQHFIQFVNILFSLVQSALLSQCCDSATVVAAMAVVQRWRDWSHQWCQQQLVLQCSNIYISVSIFVFHWCNQLFSLSAVTVLQWWQQWWWCQWYSQWWCNSGGINGQHLVLQSFYFISLVHSGATGGAGYSQHWWQ